jgi:Fe(II)/alpha-ketoglutarate-dependent arginine beta-hydroxylase
MSKLQLTSLEVDQIKTLLVEIDEKYPCFEDNTFLQNAFLYSHELPRRVKAFVHRFRIHEPEHGLCIIGGFPIDQKRIGHTPQHWQFNEDALTTRQERALMLIFSALVGDAFGWQTQQQGRLIHDVLPIKGDAYEQIGTGSEQTIWWHTEDAFHPYSADYLMLMCLRNHDEVSTTVSWPDMTGLTSSQVRVLFEPRFVVYPDNSHKSKNAGLSHPELANSDVTYDIDEALNKQAVLSGDPVRPYLRLDPYFMASLDEDSEAFDALEALKATIDRNVNDVTLQAGDIAIIDNQTVVHGRNAFKARFDGTDRWLKRLNITRDIRKSRSNRTTVNGRVIK